MSSCRTLKDPVFDGIESVSVGEVGVDSSVVTLNLKYYNPNSSGAKLTSASGSAWMENSFLGTFMVDSTVRIPARDSFRIPVKLSVDMNKLLKSSITLLFKKEVTIRIEGEARAGRNGFYKRFPVKYEGRQDISQLINF
ncbi:LEA type 2 family protein [Terrimonas sp. NA20]|uniref:LEA type 2 family protein n=1 Tax=Terrimonas ginsenosidimutans TaxID=2908004 RepID=A0ABS9KYI4_9BACT|nr:LEA type 2 family protein [Terrimonas ginsenosidimutans]MCG2617356.1 LEA type 2 family protein [Terrimonas ginsenosidimutans]